MLKDWLLILEGNFSLNKKEGFSPQGQLGISCTVINLTASKAYFLVRIAQSCAKTSHFEPPWLPSTDPNFGSTWRLRLSPLSLQLLIYIFTKLVYPNTSLPQIARWRHFTEILLFFSWFQLYSSIPNQPYNLANIYRRLWSPSAVYGSLCACSRFLSP